MMIVRLSGHPLVQDSLKRAEEELGRVKKQLEDKQGMSKPLIS